MLQGITSVVLIPILHPVSDKAVAREEKEGFAGASGDISTW
jgi:hypothetical protein